MKTSNQRRAQFEAYRPRKILNKNKRADHWFWARYSAYPYLGCQHGCAFCYCREEKYSPYEDVEDFSRLVKIKENAGELLRKELHKAPVDVIFTGDYQPLERKFEVSRRMLEVCADLGFPVMILERSPLVLRDLDILQTIHKKAGAVAAFSLIYTESSPRAGILRQMEGLAPPPARRLVAMEKIAASGILTGACVMPILPHLCDDRSNLEDLIRAIADHGGTFVLAGSLTLADRQRTFFLNMLAERAPDYLPLYQKTYPPGHYSPAGAAWNRIALDVAELCQKYRISDRMPRPVIPGEKKEFNKRLVESLANRAYSLEISNAPQNEVWEFRNAAWAVEDLEQDIRLVFHAMGRKGLESIPGLAGEGLAWVFEAVSENKPGG
jgi:DNA repair photolyase